MKLTETRAADRAKMAALLSDAMLKAGSVTATVTPCSYEPARIDVRIEAPGGAYIVVDFDGKSCQPNVHVATWNTPDAVFLNMVGMNPYHYGKCNRVAEGLENLITVLAADVARFADGTGYLAHESPAIVAMAESYAAKGWGDPRQPRNVWSAAA